MNARATIGTRTAPPADLASALEAARHDLDPYGRDIRYFESVGSTMDVARRLATQGAGDGLVVVADRQTAGRGRRGRRWFSPDRAGLYVSLLLEPLEAPIEPGLITLGAGVALAEAIRAVAPAVPVCVKWPNDLVVEPPGGARRKLGGILAEGLAVNGRLSRIILGFGINLQDGAPPPELAAHVTSLESLSGGPVDRAALLVHVLIRLRGVTGALGAGRAAEVLARWERLSPSSRGRRVAWSTAAGSRRGTTAGVDPDGALAVDTAEGRERIVSADLRWLSP